MMNSDGASRLVEPLTEREHEVLQLLAQGKSNRQLADELVLSLHTVKWYNRQIYGKLGVENREEAVGRARVLGLVAAEGEPAPPHNLPAATTPFIGRQRELAGLDALLADPADRLITIVGPGGMGKTRLALVAAERQLQPRLEGAGVLTYPYPDGVWFIPLAGPSDAGRLAPALAASLGFQFNPGSRVEMQLQLLDYLRAKRCLLVADNFEHLLDGASFLSELMSAAAGVQLLVTSRERLQLQGEQLLVLEGLEVPEEGAETAAALAAASARLFLDAARRAQPGFELAEADAPHLAHICRAVGGAPLAIELAAAWAAALPPAEIAASIERSLDFLAADIRDRPARHRSMQAALDASWQRLAPAQQTAFRQLCLFRGGFTRPAALAAAEAGLPLLVQLVYKSWLAYDQKADRYSIHELLRQYGLERLAANPAQEEQTRDAHAAYFCAFLAERESEFYGPRQLEVVGEVQADLDNVWLAWEWALGQSAVERFTSAQGGLYRFSYWVGRNDDGIDAMARAAGVLGELIAASPAPPADWLRLQADALCRQAHLTMPSRAAGPLLERATGLLDRAEALGGDVRAERAFWLSLVSRRKIDHDLAGAAEAARHSLTLFRSLGGWLGICTGLIHLANAEWWLGDFEAAADHLQEVLELSNTHGDQAYASWATGHLAAVRKLQGRLEEAEQLERRSMSMGVALRLRWREADQTCNHANTLTWHGKFEEGLVMARRGLALYEALGRTSCWVLANLAYPLPHLGRYAEARPALLRALGSTGTNIDLWVHGTVLCYLAQVALVERRYSEAEESLRQSQALLAQSGRSEVLRPLIARAYLWRLQDGPAEAALAEAISLLLEWRSPLSVMEALPVAALLTADRGDLARSAELHALSQTFPYIANSRWFYDVASHELNELVARLPAEVAQAAIGHGRKLDLWETVAQLLVELER
jgi:predicted ATPase/DNA-binding CsgD family transcriptional regulator